MKTLVLVAPSDRIFSRSKSEAEQIVSQLADSTTSDRLKSDVIPVLRELVNHGAKIKAANIGTIKVEDTVVKGRVLEIDGYDGRLPRLPENFRYLNPTELTA